MKIFENIDNYLICEKTDGVRYLLVILNNGECYLHGRKVGNVAGSKKTL